MNRTPLAAVLVGGILLLIFNSAYLAARADPTIAYYLNVALHPVLGLALAALAGWRFRTCWKATAFRALTAGMLAVATALGIAVLIVGATRPYYRVVGAHAAAAVAGIALLSVELWRTSRVGRPSVKKIVAGSIALVFIAACSAALIRATRDGERARSYRIINPATVPATMDAGRRRSRRPVLPFVGGNGGERHHPGQLLHGERLVWPVPSRYLRAVELVDAPLRVVQQPVVPQVDRVHAGRGRYAALEVVCRVPRPRAAVQWPIRSAGEGSDRDAGSAGGPELHLLPCDHESPRDDGTGRVRDRILAAARDGRKSQSAHPRGT